MSLLQELELDNDSFAQELDSLENNDFEARRKGRLVRVPKRKRKGKVVYGKSGKRLKGRYAKI